MRIDKVGKGEYSVGTGDRKEAREMMDQEKEKALAAIRSADEVAAKAEERVRHFAEEAAKAEEVAAYYAGRSSKLLEEAKCNAERAEKAHEIAKSTARLWRIQRICLTATIIVNIINLIMILMRS